MKRMACSFLLSCHGLAAFALAQEPPAAPPREAVPAPQPAVEPDPDPQPVIEPDPDAEPAPVEQAVVHDLGAPAKVDITLDRRTLIRAGVGFSGPLGATGSVQILHGLGADIDDEGTRVRAVCAIPMPRCAQGFLLRADAGTGGGKLSLGLGALAKVDEEDFKGTAGAGLRLALAHTWGDPIGEPAGITYLGPELDLSVLRINLTVGALFRVGGDGGSSALFSWGLGFGL
jgi:hypothetical protein